jgi:hypothetical protein
MEFIGEGRCIEAGRSLSLRIASPAELAEALEAPRTVTWVNDDAISAMVDHADKMSSPLSMICCGNITAVRLSPWFRYRLSSPPVALGYHHRRAVDESCRVAATCAWARGGSISTLDHEDGTVNRIDGASTKVTATLRWVYQARVAARNGSRWFKIRDLK